MPKNIIEAIDLANTASAYYAPATAVPSTARLIHVSGQPGTTKDGVVPGDYESQIHLALLNLRKVIITAGAAVTDIVKLTLLIVNYDAQRRIHARHVQRFLAGHRPAVTLVPVAKLAAEPWLFEIEAVVAVPETPRAPAQSPRAGADTREPESVDVVVVGAGLAGLTAARDVVDAGLSCVVLEGRDRVGGKTWSVPLAPGGEAMVDLGAAWINDTNQSRVYGLARQFGAELIEQNTDGDAVLQNFDGTCWPFPYGAVPDFDDQVRQQMADVRDAVEADCQEVDVWEPKDASLDSLTFAGYLRAKGVGSAAMASATVWTRAMLGQEPGDISALYFLNYCKSGGGLLQMRSDRKGGGQHLRIRQGTQFFSKGLASLLPEGVIRLRQPVRAISHTGPDSVRVETGEAGGGPTITARKVILTVPGPALKGIAFEPPLPPSRQLLADSLTYGFYAKVLVEFRAPFWADRGFCGLAQSFVGPASIVRDTSVPRDAKHVLTCFMAGDPGRAWAALSSADRQQHLLAQLARLFDYSGVEEQFVQLATHEWVEDEFAGRGCPCTALGPGVLHTLGGGHALREPCGNLHFAGTETAGEWKGYMEGAVRSGERGAREAIEALSTAKSSRL